MGHPRSHPVSISTRRTIRSVVCVLAAMVLVTAATLLLTPFRSPREVLSEGTWGIGRTSTSVMTGFALGRPWWRLHAPSGLTRTPAGAVPDEVRIPRDEIVEFDDETTLPHRSIGYDATLGALTAVRSAFSSALVFDWWTVVRFQQGALVVALLAPILSLVMTLRPRHRPTAAAAYATTFAAFLAVRPFESTWLIDGIIDSSLAAPAALLAIPLVVCIADRDARVGSPRLLIPSLVGLTLGFFTMLRGELVFPFLLATVVVAAWQVELRRSEPETSHVHLRLKPVLRVCGLLPAFVAAAAILVVPIAYGISNVAIHGHFIPFRLQSGQNLVEPIGEFENPWGIEYSDTWMNAELESRGLAYISFEADSELTRQYVDMLAQEPMLFVRNFLTRLARLPSDLALGLLGPFSLPVLLALALWMGRRLPQTRAALVPLVLSIGLVLFHAWFGSPGRVLAPVRFLMVCAVCAAAASAAAWLAEALRRNTGIAYAPVIHRFRSAWLPKQPARSRSRY